MGLLYWPRRVGGIDDDYSVQFHRAARFEGIGLAAAMRARERNRPSIRIDDHVRLVGRTPLQVDVSHPTHVLLFAALTDAAIVLCQHLSRHHRCDSYRHARNRALARSK